MIFSDDYIKNHLKEIKNICEDGLSCFDENIKTIMTECILKSSEQHMIVLKEIEKDSWLESQHIYQGGLGI